MGGYVAMIIVRSAFALLFVFTFGFYSSSFAQSSSTTGSIIGTVKDPQGGSLVGATIAAKQTKTNLERTTQVGEDGIYHFVQLPPGNYEVKALVEGFAPNIETTTVNIGSTALVEIVLSIGGS